MVEFALILPILILLLVIAADFGRVFFQWVGVSNASRIGANYAARNPDVWGTPGDPAGQLEYATLVARDLNPLNCTALDGSEMTPSDVPTPAFTGLEVGDQASVTLQCRFRVLTPIASLILGGDQFTVTAGSTFTVNGGRISGIPVGVVPPGTGTAPCSDVIVPNLFGKTVVDAEDVWTGRFDGAFSAPPTALPEDVVDSQMTTPPASPGDCVDASTSVTVTVVTASGPCPSGQARVPSLVDLTVATARIEWTDADFTGAFLPATGSDTEIVSSQAVSSGHAVGECAPITALVVVGSAPTAEYCTAEILTGLKKAPAKKKYEDANFTGTFTAEGNQSGSVTGQKLTAGQMVPCSSDEVVTLN
jgi:Flp pilus assembly protein TadG